MQSAKYLTSPEWTDDQKATVLFSPFRDKSLNPHSWETKMKFWTEALLECAQIQQSVILDLKTFTKYFERDGKCPKCLDTVVTDMARTGKLKKLSDFQRQSNSWTYWGFDSFVRRPVVWGLNKLISSEAVPGEEMFVIPEQVKRKVKDVLSHHHNQVQHETTDNMMELSAFREQCSHVLQSETEFDVILKQLELDKKVLVSTNKEQVIVVKICCQSEEKVRPVQEIDFNIFRIQRVMKCLETQMGYLSHMSESYTAEARKLVKEGKKTLALHQLRKRRTAQRQLERKSSCFDTLYDIIHKIEDASSNEMVVKAYESGVKAIKQVTGGVTVDKLDKVLDDLQQVLEEQEEASQAIAGVSVPGLDLSTDDLEMELNSLLSEGAERGNHNVTLPQSDKNIDDLISGLSSSSLDDLPEVPSFSPGKLSTANSPSKTTELPS